MIISGAISLSLIPFCLVRVYQQEWAVAALNIIAVLLTSSFFFHVYFTNKTAFARWGLAVQSVVVMTVTIYLKGAEQIMWVFPALTITFYLLPPRIAVGVCCVFMLGVLILVADQLSQMAMLTFVVSSTSTFLFCFAFSSRMRAQADMLATIAITDPLTSVGNRRALEDRLAAIVSRLRRYPDQVCSLAMFDIDHFKGINDEYGHPIGDQILIKFSALIEARIRESDRLYRYGGEEFVLVLENTEVLKAVQLATELGSDIENMPSINNLPAITVSSGIAQYVKSESVRDWLSRADIALYEAKSNGRNCCFAHEDNLTELIKQAKASSLEHTDEYAQEAQ